MESFGLRGSFGIVTWVRKTLARIFAATRGQVSGGVMQA